MRTAHNGSSVNHGDVLISSIVFLWPAAEVLQPLFHYLKANAILTGFVTPFDAILLSWVILMAIGWALVVFPQAKAGK